MEPMAPGLKHVAPNDAVLTAQAHTNCGVPQISLAPCRAFVHRHVTGSHESHQQLLDTVTDVASEAVCDMLVHKSTCNASCEVVGTNVGDERVGSQIASMHALIECRLTVGHTLHR